MQTMAQRINGSTDERESNPQETQRQEDQGLSSDNVDVALEPEVDTSSFPEAASRADGPRQKGPQKHKKGAQGRGGKGKRKHTGEASTHGTAEKPTGKASKTRANVAAAPPNSYTVGF